MRITFSLLCFWLCSMTSFTQSLPTLKASVYHPALKGYYFLSAAYSGATFFLVLDHTGSVAYYKPLIQKKTSPYNFALQANGWISYSNQRSYLFMDSTFRIVDSVQCKNLYQTDPHDMRWLPNGHFLLLGMDTVSMDLRKDSVGKKFEEVDTILGWRAAIQELDAKKNVVFDWRAKDHFGMTDADTFLFGILLRMLDMEHVNAVESDQDGNILLSCRNYSEITKINRSDGSIMWRLGGKRNQFTFVNCPVPFYGQHDIRRISNGNITLFDGGQHQKSHGARALEFELDEVKKIATLKWSYTYDTALVSHARGNVQRLDHGYTLVNYGGVGTASEVVFVVVDKGGRKLFELNSPDHLDSYRSFYYPKLPWKVNPPAITCFDSLGVKYLKTTQDYSSYQWSDSSVTRTIAVTKPGNYFVFVPYGEGGFIRSEQLLINDVNALCNSPKKRKP
ncbi:MAG: aryl-sulfate sulfotransferase [Bacteroidetes bacterium]|nr:aryl-sulfate sulfotransferase [Bacteroidota bacterium]